MADNGQGIRAALHGTPIQERFAAEQGGDQRFHAAAFFIVGGMGGLERRARRRGFRAAPHPVAEGVPHEDLLDALAGPGTASLWIISTPSFTAVAIQLRITAREDRASKHPRPCPVPGCEICQTRRTSEKAARGDPCGLVALPAVSFTRDAHHRGAAAGCVSASSGQLRIDVDRRVGDLPAQQPARESTCRAGWRDCRRSWKRRRSQGGLRGGMPGSRLSSGQVERHVHGPFFRGEVVIFVEMHSAGNLLKRVRGRKQRPFPWPAFPAVP